MLGLQSGVISFFWVAFICVPSASAASSNISAWDNNNNMTDFHGENKAWNAALDGVFSMESQSNPVSNNEFCRRSISDLMTRQMIPQKIEDIRKLDDVALYKMAMLASVGGMSRWVRDAADSALLTITEEGHLIHPYSPGAVESDVMLCVICALLTVIATFHLIPQNFNQVQQPKPITLLTGSGTTSSAAPKNQFFHVP